MLEKLEKIEYAFVYGSFARGDEGGSNDIDLMIVGKPDMGGIHKRIMKIEGKMGREINYSIYSLGEIQRKATLGGFINELIARKKVFVAGLEDEFEQAVEKHPL